MPQTGVSPWTRILALSRKTEICRTKGSHVSTNQVTGDAPHGGVAGSCSRGRGRVHWRRERRVHQRCLSLNLYQPGAHVGSDSPGVVRRKSQCHQRDVDDGVAPGWIERVLRTHHVYVGDQGWAAHYLECCGNRRPRLPFARFTRLESGHSDRHCDASSVGPHRVGGRELTDHVDASWSTRSVS